MIRLLLGDSRVEVNAVDSVSCVCWNGELFHCVHIMNDAYAFPLAASRKLKWGSTPLLLAVAEQPAHVARLLLSDLRVDINATDTVRGLRCMRESHQYALRMSTIPRSLDAMR